MRDATLTAARAMLEGTAASQLSMREIAKAAGVSHAAPYKHFAERSGFVVALAARCMGEFVAAQRAAVQRGADARDALIRLGVAYVEYAAEHPHAFALIFDPDVNPPDSTPPELTALVAEHTRLLADAVLAAAQAQVLAEGARSEDVMTSLWAVVHGLAHLVILGHVDRARVAQVLDAHTMLAGP